MKKYFAKNYLFPLIIVFSIMLFFSPTLFPQQLSVKQLTFSESTHDGYPYWSPDGKKIAFSSTRSGYWAIWVIELDLDYIKDKMKNNLAWIIHKSICEAQRMKPYSYTANVLQQSRSTCPKGKIRRHELKTRELLTALILKFEKVNVNR